MVILKICVISDTHLSSSKYSKVDKATGLSRFLVRQFETLEWVVNYCKEHYITTMVHGGDVFDSSKVTVFPIKEARRIFGGIDNVYAIKGNHDDNSFLHENEISAIDLVGINAINKPYNKVFDGVNFVFIPWGYEIDENLVDPTRKNVLVAHGFPKDYYNSGCLSNLEINNGGILSKKTQLFDLVITGHYHSIDEFTSGKTRFLNPGSISATANDSGDDPSIWILDTENLSYKRVKIPVAVKLIKAAPKDVNDFLQKISEENIYRLSINSKENIDRKSFLKAQKAALDIQLKLLSTNTTNSDCEITELDKFWDYVAKNSSYEDDFKNTINILRTE